MKEIIVVINKGERMLKEQRHQIIVDYLRVNQFAKVETLAKLTSSSEITTRRDIIELDQLGKVEKVHGGAQSKQNAYFDIDLHRRSQEKLEIKESIARKASEYVKDGMSVYLDAGSTVSAIIPYLQGKNLTIYTHGVHHIQNLAKYGLNVHFIGGDLKPETLACVGSSTVLYLKQFSYDLAFLGTNAYDENEGYSTPDVNEAMIKKAVISNSSLSFILADTSKLGKRSKVFFADASIPLIDEK